MQVLGVVHQVIVAVGRLNGARVNLGLTGGIRDLVVLIDIGRADMQGLVQISDKMTEEEQRFARGEVVGIVGGILLPSEDVRRLLDNMDDVIRPSPHLLHSVVVLLKWDICEMVVVVLRIVVDEGEHLGRFVGAVFRTVSPGGHTREGFIRFEQAPDFLFGMTARKDLIRDRANRLMPFIAPAERSPWIYA